ncbi:MAG: hypothetical protein KGK07_15955 [Chloroflexota bacterium]|nr:hypothetical protein [Chloroflexota bacterium]
MSNQTAADRIGSIGPQARSFVPIVGRILIKPDPPEEYKGQLVIPDTAKSKAEIEKMTATGVVVSIGPGMPVKDTVGLDADPPWPVVNGRRRWPMPDGIIAGSRVLYRKHATFDIELDGDKYVVARDTHLEGEILDGDA